MTNTTKKTIAMAKLVNLASALEAVGIEADIMEINSGSPLLMANLWNCEDGSTIRLEVCADRSDNYAFQTVAHPIQTINDYLKELMGL